MFRLMVGVAAFFMGTAFMAGSSSAQEMRAQVRTYAGMSYVLDNASVEVFYTIGEPKE